MEFVNLIPSFGGLLFTIATFLVALLIIIAVHEYGHYIVGRWSGIHAEVFSLGFGPIIWSRYDKRGTRWQLAALPFGGYVKFLGDASAASSKDTLAMDAMSEDQLRHTMHSAPLWARAITVAAGPAFNFILSVLVFGAVIAFRGIASDPLTIDELRPVPYLQELQAGDEILAIAGQKTPALDNFEGYIDSLPVAPQVEYTVLRDGREVSVSAPVPYPAMIGGVTPGSAAIDAGLKTGDVIVSVDGIEMHAFSELRSYVGKSDGTTLQLEIWREGETLAVPLQPRRMDLPLADGGFETRWLIGITGTMLFVPATETPGLWGAISKGAQQTYFVVQSSVSGLYHVVIGSISSCNLRGPIGIAQTSGEVASQGVSNFIWFIAVLSTAVGFLNLFPIPVLDGGHLVFHAYEAIVGRPPSDGAMRILMAIGLALLLGLMVFALSNDLFCP
ncbi:MAG: RIP metalloprotease RseP [Marinosulfonomonas sp.]|nr:RIP metalloprotease RseP [Marinosulfonomonas sp.]